MTIVPFQIPWDPEGIADLKRRLSETRWNDAVVSDWSYGMERKFLQKLIGYWRNSYDWAKRRSALNRMPHYRAMIDGYGVHFLHYRGRGTGAVPLLRNSKPPKDIAQAPRELAARLYNVQRYTVFAKGGHFPAYEQPVLFAEDLQQFESTVRPD